jgi:RHS repeat-associated protein
VLQLSESEVATPDLPARDLETRIGPSGFSGATRTEPLSFVSGTSNRACGDRAAEIAMGSSSPSIDEPLALYASGAITYLDVDGLGSAIATNDPAGSMTSAAIFDAWGTQTNPLSTRLHPFTYTGREVGEAGLLGYRARQYQPSTGMFVSADPSPLSRGTFDVYRYASADPLRNVDPLGLWSTHVHNLLIDFVFGNLNPPSALVLPPWEVGILRQASADIDVNQDPQIQYQHAMRAPNESPEHAAKQWAAFICRRLHVAQNYAAANNRSRALYELGLGMHAIMDSTAPGHLGFQSWRGMPKGLRDLTANWKYYGGHAAGDEFGSYWNNGSPWGTAVEMMRRYYHDFETGGDCFCK